MFKFYASLIAEIPTVFRGSVEGVMFWVLSVIVPVAVFFVPEWKPLTAGETFSRWLVLAPIGLSALYAIARVNFKRHEVLSSTLDREQHANADLGRRVQARQRNQALADALTDQHAYGIHELLNKRPANVEDFADWLTRENAWTAGVLALMENQGCTKQEIHHVRTLGLFSWYPLHPEPDINHQLCMLAARLNRVADISTKHCQEGS
jgi:hypothetical protein